MKKLLLFYIGFLLNCSCFAQDKKVSNVTDTIQINNITIQHQVTLVIDSITIITPYEEFLDFLKTLNKKVFKASYLRVRHREINAVISMIKSERKEADTISITDTIKNKVGYQFIAAHIAQMIETGKAVILDKNKIPQTQVIRKRTSYQRDVLDGWGGRKYFLRGTNNYFLVVTDWMS